jgi:predicted choloylglycine hydrolase
MGRSYEWTFTEEELLLLTTRVKGKASHIGFSLGLASRYDGINEHGFLVSMTGAGIFNVPLQQKGLACWVVIRSLLDQSKSVEDALNQIQPATMSGHFSLVLADASGHAALVEFADGDMEVKQTNNDDPKPWIFSVNHYNLPKIGKHNKLNCGIITHSTLRQALITDLIQEKRPKISKEDLRRLFATSHPDGLCNYFYRDGFGTLWSMLFDVTEKTVDVCFSAPTHNEYHTFRLDDPIGVPAYPAVFPILPWS